MFPRITTALLTLGLLTAMPVLAEEHESVPPVTNPIAKKECGSCHMPFPAKMLSATAWTTILDNLPQHFGENASLPDNLRSQVQTYYAANAGRSQPGLIRITEQSWWLHEHRAVGDTAFHAAKSRANCAACHKGAERGEFED